MNQIFNALLKYWNTGTPEQRRQCAENPALYYKILLLFFSILLFNPDQTNAQIQAPDLICVKNDTLFWNTPVNNCGAFNAYVIYSSTNVAGPYQILATITDPAQTSYFHENAGTAMRYYYLQSDYNCPGQITLSSDTLDNRIPEAGKMRYVSVVGDDVEIGWETSPSPEVFAYIVYKNTPSGTAVVDTVFTGITYVDTTANASESPETYYVVAIDRCGNNSLIPPPQTTMLLEAKGASACDRTATLSWNAYQNWGNPVDKYEILVSENGSAPKLAGEAAGNATSFTFQNANAGINYCFTVRAIESGTGNTASSSEACLTLDVIPAVTELVLTNATVALGNNVNISWLWNEDAAIETVEILRASSTGNFSRVSSESPQPPLSRDNSFLDENANPSERALTYQIQTTDACDVTVQSNTVSTIFLEVQSQGNAGENLVRWTPYENDFATAIVYELYRQTESGTPVLVTTITAGSLEYIDLVDPNNAEEASACYFVIAKTNLDLPDGSTFPVESRSNIDCATQETRIYIPNAFAPNGVNREFKPIIPFGQPDSYSMIIFDRWGSKVFETQNIDGGWNGTVNGREASQGVYVYQIRLKQADGKVTEHAGSLVLVR